jgi:hypothetical protein
MQFVDTVVPADLSPSFLSCEKAWWLLSTTAHCKQPVRLPACKMPCSLLACCTSSYTTMQIALQTRFLADNAERPRRPCPKCANNKGQTSRLACQEIFVTVGGCIQLVSRDGVFSPHKSEHGNSAGGRVGGSRKTSLSIKRWTRQEM